ncbi:MAG: hypothetical protein ISQ13_02780 [Candidatus Margulisbacteria bacterium]|nr:hypothetical protein [Candidatus Margulisiibacteriota bacterium]
MFKIVILKELFPLFPCCTRESDGKEIDYEWINASRLFLLGQGELSVGRAEMVGKMLAFLKDDPNGLLDVFKQKHSDVAGKLLESQQDHDAIGELYDFEPKLTIIIQYVQKNNGSKLYSIIKGFDEDKKGALTELLNNIKQNYANFNSFNGQTLGQNELGVKPLCTDEFVATKIMNNYNDAFQKLLGSPENAHDFVQILFPTSQKSGFQNKWCVLTDGVIELLKNTPGFHDQYNNALQSMLAYWGIQINHNMELQVFDEDNFNSFLMEKNHNQLRASRVIQSLREFGQLGGIHTAELAGKFYLLLKEKAQEWLDGNDMSDDQKENLKKSMGFWENALVNPLHDRDYKRCREDVDDGSHQSKRQRQEATTFDISFSIRESIDAVSYPIAIGSCDDEERYLFYTLEALFNGIGKQPYPNGLSRENHDGPHALRKVAMAYNLIRKVENHGTPAAKDALSKISPDRLEVYMVALFMSRMGRIDEAEDGDFKACSAELFRSLALNIGMEGDDIEKAAKLVEIMTSSSGKTEIDQLIDEEEKKEMQVMLLVFNWSHNLDMCRPTCRNGTETFDEIQGWLNKDDWFDAVFSESVEKQELQRLLFDISKVHIAATDNVECKNSFEDCLDAINSALVPKGLPNVGNTCYMHSGIQLLRQLELNGSSMTTILENISEDGDTMILTHRGMPHVYPDDCKEYVKNTTALWLQLLNPKSTFDDDVLIEMFETILKNHQSSDVKLGEMGDPLQFIQSYFLEMFLPFEQFKHVRTEIKRTGCVDGEFFEISNKSDMSFFVIAQRDWRGESTSIEEIEPDSFLKRGLNPNKLVVDLDGADESVTPFETQTVTVSTDVFNSRSTLIQFTHHEGSADVPSFIDQLMKDEQLDRIHFLSIHIEANDPFVAHHIVVVRQYETFYEIDDGKVEEIHDIGGYINQVNTDRLRTIQCGIFNVEGMQLDGSAKS